MNAEFRDALFAGAEALGISIDDATVEKLSRYVSKLVQWNRKVNLTAITAPAEIAEKHILDSLTLLKHLGAAKTLLDIGSGAGLPGVALACARPDIEVTCCDSVSKKVTFIKAVAADLDLAVTGVSCRAAGDPEAEGLPIADLVVSRALTDPREWVPLGVQYVAAGGRLLGMLGQESDQTALNDIGQRSGLKLAEIDRFELPFSKAKRGIAIWLR